jgi:hypothetical protein
VRHACRVKLKRSAWGVDEAEPEYWARQLSWAGTAQAAAFALLDRYGGIGRAEWKDLHPNYGIGPAIQNVWSIDLRTLADEAGFADAVFLLADTRFLARVNFGDVPCSVV